VSGKKMIAAPEGYSIPMLMVIQICQTRYGGVFHTTTAQALYLQKHGRPDIQTAFINTF